MTRMKAYQEGGMGTVSSLEAQPSGYRWVIFVVLALAYLLVFFHRLSPAVVALDMMRDLGASATLMGILASAYFYPYAAMQLPAGLLADSWGPRKTITSSFVVAGVASILFGLTESATVAIIARVFVGLGVAFCFVSVMKVLTQWFKVSEFSLMAGLLLSMGGLGALCAATPLALLSEVLGWRGSFIVIGVVTTLLSAVIWLVVRNRPQDMGLPAPEPFRSGDSAAKAPQQRVSLRDGVKIVLRKWHFWPLGFWLFCNAGIFFSFSGLWGGPYLMHVYGLSKTQAGNILGMMALAMVVGCPLTSHLSEVLRSRKLVLLGGALLQLALCSVIAFGPTLMPAPVLYVWSFLFGVGGSGVVAVAYTVCKEMFSVEIAGTAVGLTNLFPFLGGALMQPLVGLVLQAKEGNAASYAPETYGAGFLVYVVLAVAGIAAALLTRETYGRRENGV